MPGCLPNGKNSRRAFAGGRKCLVNIAGTDNAQGRGRSGPLNSNRDLSFRRKPESHAELFNQIPAFAGMTCWGCRARRLEKGKGYFKILKSPIAMLVASAGPAMRSHTPLPIT